MILKRQISISNFSFSLLEIEDFNKKPPELSIENHCIFEKIKELKLIYLDKTSIGVIALIEKPTKKVNFIIILFYIHYF